MKEITFKQYIAKLGYKTLKVWKNHEGYYAIIKGYVSSPNSNFTSVTTPTGGSIVRLSLKDIDNPLIVGKDVKVVFEGITESHSKLRSIVREILSEMQDDELEETTFTGNVDGYNIPGAFKKTDGRDEDDEPDSEHTKKLNQSTGYVKVNEAKKKLSENRWAKLRSDETQTPKQKIGLGIREIKTQLTEIENFLKWYNKIKLENDIAPTDYWKRTNKNLAKIRERVNNITSLIRDLNR